MFPVGSNNKYTHRAAPPETEFFKGWPNGGCIQGTVPSLSPRPPPPLPPRPAQLYAPAWCRLPGIKWPARPDADRQGGEMLMLIYSLNFVMKNSGAAQLRRQRRGVKSFGHSACRQNCLGHPCSRAGELIGRSCDSSGSRGSPTSTCAPGAIRRAELESWTMCKRKGLMHFNGGPPDRHTSPDVWGSGADVGMSGQALPTYSIVGLGFAYACHQPLVVVLRQGRKEENRRALEGKKHK